MTDREFFVVGVTHVDLAWKRGPEEMSEMMEVVVIRLLDALERNPDFKYHLEQVAHFRELARRRPDLIERLRPFLESGRLEFAGGMASTLDTNLPHGESYIRNQQIGLKWLRETWGDIPITTGWLVDTFGVNPQVPQLLRGFGIRRLVASRLGGTHTRDLFTAHGLDRSEVAVAAWNTNGAYTHPENVSWSFYRNWDHLEDCFARADALTGPGPYLVMPYTENEYLVSLRPLEILRERDRDRPGQSWRCATPADFFDALEKSGRELPAVGADLNPEFTGCFSLRHAIRPANRRAETLLLEAEMWSALAGVEAEAVLEPLWWELAYVQFHDVFTGSHPTVVYRDVMERLAGVAAKAESVRAAALARFAPPASGPGYGVAIFNSLPWDRRDIADVPLPAGWKGVARVCGAGGESLPFAVQNGAVRVLADTPSVGPASLTLEPASEAAPPVSSRVAEAASLENEWVRLDLDTVLGVARLTWKPTGTVLMEDAGSWLLAQRDDGNFQIENPSGAEVAASSGTFRLEVPEASSPLGASAVLSGAFPPLRWAGAGSRLAWEAEFFVPVHRPEVRLTLRLDWKGEATRVRLTLPTTLDTGSGIYEVPFGVVRRKPYPARVNAKGEWPAQRFVALESSGYGVALANTGVGGVEVGGGTLATTLLRAPQREYAGMVADDTSSQHGAHEFTFAILPYAGSWEDAGIARLAQERNAPLVSVPAGGTGAAPGAESWLRLEPADQVVLSSVRAAGDGGGLEVRVYETAGRAAEAALTVPGARAAWESDLRGQTGAALPVDGGRLRVTLCPFEIRTLRIVTEAGEGRDVR